MIDERRYVLIEYSQVTQAMIDTCLQTSFETLRHVRFANDATDWVLLKWKGIKPPELWGEFPVYSDEEMLDILRDDLNSQPTIKPDGTPN